MDFLLIALLTLLNGVFAMSELALASSRKLRLAAMADDGDKGARAALRLLDDPTQFLSSVQVGITSIGMLNGIVGEAAFSADLGLWLRQLGMPEAAAGITATAPSCSANWCPSASASSTPRPWRALWRGPWRAWRAWPSRSCAR